MNSVFSSFKRVLIFIFDIIVLVTSLYTFSYNFIYQSINVVTSTTMTIEYGSANTDVRNFVNKVDGEIISVKNEIETNVVGIQEIVLVVAKCNISKEIPIAIEIKDTVAPIISLVSDTITIKQGDSLDLLNNIESVIDSVDGEIPYVEDALVDANNYYSVDGEVNPNALGTYTVNVHAVDKNNNSSDKEFTVVVQENEISTRVVSMAYSLLNSPYVLGANGPYAFDCSGFVQYLYWQVGIEISRGSSTQMFDGVAVDYEEILPGDIISWGYSDDFATHSALYVGNGKMIHAANPSDGVIISDVIAWECGSGTKIISIRRIK